MRLLVLVMIAGCEMEVAPAPPPSHHPLAAAYVDVVAREHGTNRPLAGVPVTLVHVPDVPRTHLDPVPPASYVYTTTDPDGVAHVARGAGWRVEAVGPIDGYVTWCPFHNSSGLETRHALVTETPTLYACDFMPVSSLVVRDDRTAIRIAGEVPEMKRWLAKHRGATSETDGMRAAEYEIYFDKDNCRRLVVVDAVDGTAFVMGRWTDHPFDDD